MGFFSSYNTMDQLESEYEDTPRFRKKKFKEFSIKTIKDDYDVEIEFISDSIKIKSIGYDKLISNLMEENKEVNSIIKGFKDAADK